MYRFQKKVSFQQENIEHFLKFIFRLAETTIEQCAGFVLIEFLCEGNEAKH